jgi:DNA-binding beta-propeller fold protein YncE
VGPTLIGDPVPVGGVPHDMSLSADGLRAFVTDTASDALVLVADTIHGGVPTQDRRSTPAPSTAIRSDPPHCVTRC